MKLISDGKPLYLTAAQGKQFRLIEDWIFQHGRLNTTFIVPKGFRSDLASIPSWIWWWQWGKWNISAILHDYCYSKGEIIYLNEKGHAKAGLVSKKQADKIFYEITISLGVSPLTAELMYWAVRLFGRGIWTKDKK